VNKHIYGQNPFFTKLQNKL